MTENNTENNDVQETPVVETQATEESKTVEELQAELAKITKERDDFKQATFKYKEQAKAKKETPKTLETEHNFMTEEDFVLRTNQITDTEDKTFVKTFAKSSGISIEEALANSAVQGELARRNEVKNTAKASEGLGDGTPEEAYLTDKQFINEFEAGRLETSKTNVDKYMDLTRKSRLSS